MSYERFRDWLEEALDDLEAARELFQFGRWSKVCFLSHQAVEKALKALCIKKLGVYSQTHSIAKLIEDVRGVIVIPAFNSIEWILTPLHFLGYISRVNIFQFH